MPPTKGGVVLIGGGGSGGRFAVRRLNMVGSEDIKLVCNGENGRRIETQSGISILIIVWTTTWLTPCNFAWMLLSSTNVRSPYRSNQFYLLPNGEDSASSLPAWLHFLLTHDKAYDGGVQLAPASCLHLRRLPTGILIPTTLWRRRRQGPGTVAIYSTSRLRQNSELLWRNIQVIASRRENKRDPTNYSFFNTKSS